MVCNLEIMSKNRVPSATDLPLLIICPGDKTTGCPKVRVYFDTLLFSGLGGPITKSFDVLIAEGGWFFFEV